MVNSGEACKHRHGGPALRQPSLKWHAPHKQVKLLSFEMEVSNILQTKTYELNEEDEVPIIKKWLGRETASNSNIYKFWERGLQKSRRSVYYARRKIQTVAQNIILSLQYCKLKRKSRESVQEWMGRLHIMPYCKYQEYDRRLKEKFINGLNSEAIIAEIIKELISLKDTSEVSSEHVLMWA